MITGIMITPEAKEHLKLHIEDALEDLGRDKDQVEFNLFEIADHLGIKTEVNKDKN